MEKKSGKRFCAELCARFKDSATASHARGSLMQETEFKRRCSAEVSIERDSVRVSLVSGDLPVLRAALNSYIRLLYIFEGIESVEAGEGDSNDEA